MKGREPRMNWRAQLRSALMDYFDESELTSICFDLGIDYENISRDTKRETVIQIIEHCIRVDRVDELIDLCSHQRPNVPWDEIAAAAGVWSRGRSKPSAIPRAWGDIDEGQKNTNLLVYSIVGIVVLGLAFTVIWLAFIRESPDDVEPTVIPAVTQTATPVFAGISTDGLEKIYGEDFSTTDSSWGELGSKSYGAVVADFRIESQAFRKTLTTVNEAPWFNWSPNVPGVVSKDFFYVMDATLVDTSDLNAASVLLAFRISDDNWSLYTILIGVRGYTIGEITDNRYTEIVPWTPSNLIQFQKGVRNTFGILAKDSEFTVFINGQELESFSDDTHSSAGAFGFGMHIETLGQTATFEFDNLAIYAVP